MSERVAFTIFFTGFIIILFGVGGIEASQDNLGLFYGLMVSMVGCLVMLAGVIGLQDHERT